jgi:putative lipoprotein (rSAM/lipoprotein system)
MKKIYRPLLKGTNWALGGLLSLLGFACNSHDILPPEYGVPHARYSVKGSVTDTLGAPVPGIEIRIKTDHEAPIEEKEIYTDKEGGFDVTYMAFPREKFILTAKDIDGEANGSFKTDSVEVVFTEDDYYEKGDGRWYDGAAKKEISPIVLKEEGKEADE